MISCILFLLSGTLDTTLIFNKQSADKGPLPVPRWSVGHRLNRGSKDRVSVTQIEAFVKIVQYTIYCIVTERERYLYLKVWTARGDMEQ